MRPHAERNHSRLIGNRRLNDIDIRQLVQGNVLGMYLFGYGNFVSSNGIIGVNFSRHFAAVGGYQLGSRLHVNGTHDHLGLRITQKGAIAGLQVSY